jgi:hypothetical protein
MRYWYLSSPYSKYPRGIVQAHADVCREAARLIRLGLPIFSPIAHSYAIAIHGGLNPFDHEIWLPADQPMMDAAYGLIVSKMEGWDMSYGLRYEIDTFYGVGKPIVYLSPGETPDPRMFFVDRKTQAQTLATALTQRMTLTEVEA